MDIFLQKLKSISIFLVAVSLLSIGGIQKGYSASDSNSETSEVAAQQQQTVNVKKVTLKHTNSPINNILRDISKQTGITFEYASGLSSSALGNFSINVSGVTTREALTTLFQSSGYGFVANGDRVTISRKVDVAKSNVDNFNKLAVRGRVIDKSKQPLVGATVIIRGTSYGTSTDGDGEFKLNGLLAKSITPRIEASYIGMLSHTLDYKDDYMTIVLEDDNYSINDVEVVYTGYQALSPREMGASIATVKAEDVVNPSFQSIDQMLEGAVAGMTFLQSSGQVGAAPKLRIRGTTTILGSQEPLWVVDGVVMQDPVDIDPSLINDLDFVNLLGNAISGINPDDIEQIDVLKDAAATAIYGSSAANGVIVITTKTGKAGRPVVTYSHSVSITQAADIDDLNMMNSLERVELSRDLIDSRQVYPNVTSWVGYESLYRDYTKGSISYEDFSSQAAYYETLNTDWCDLLLQNSVSTKHNINVSGGSDNIRYYASLGVDQTSGNIIGDEYRQYTASTNITASYDKFTIRFGMNGYVSNKDYAPSDLDVMEYAYTTSRAIPATNADGSYWYYDREPTSTLTSDQGSSVYPFNIMEDIENSYYKVDGSGVTMSMNATYDINKKLAVNGTLSYSLSNTTSATYYSADTSYGRMLKNDYGWDSYTDPTAKYQQYTLMPVGGELSTSTTDRDTYSARLSASYEDYFGSNKEHKITATLGGELSSTSYDTFSLTARGFDPDRGSVMIGVDDLSSYSSYAEWTQTQDALGVYTLKKDNDVAAYFSMGYGYEDRYYASINGRVEYSNEFGSRANEKFFPIWAVAGRWNMHNDVVKDVDWVNSLALRASFGYQGNVPSTSTEVVIQTGGYDQYFGGEAYSSIYSYANPDLMWEKTASTNLGVDFSLFGNKINGTIEYYYRLTTDAYVTETVSEVNGITNYTVNKGNLENHGWDLTLNFVPINNMTSVDGEVKGFRWRFDPQLGQIINQVLDAATTSDSNTLLDDDDIYYSSYLNGSAVVKGYSVNSFWSYQYNGLSSDLGIPTFKNLDEYVTIEGVEVSTASLLLAMATNEERMLSIMDYSGSRTPIIQGSLNNTFTYNNLSLGINLTYGLGSKIRLIQLYSDISSTSGTIAPQPTQNVSKSFIDRWQQSGDEKYTDIPAIIDYSYFDSTMDEMWWLTDTDLKSSGNALSGSLWEMYDYSDLRVVSGNYLKIQSISLRYNLPNKVCAKTFFSSAYVSFTGTNLYTFCSKDLNGQDPTTSTSGSYVIPVLPAYSFAFSVSF
ncbi:MAG: SusC/RagA family TonB-linked outer membrane protein [Rikenellaceae bacterium]